MTRCTCWFYCPDGVQPTVLNVSTLGPQSVTLQPDNRRDRRSVTFTSLNSVTVNWAEADSINTAVSMKMLPSVILLLKLLFSSFS